MISGQDHENWAGMARPALRNRSKSIQAMLQLWKLRLTFAFLRSQGLTAYKIGQLYNVSPAVVEYWYKKVKIVT